MFLSGNKSYTINFLISNILIAMELAIIFQEKENFLKKQVDNLQINWQSKGFKNQRGGSSVG